MEKKLETNAPKKLSYEQLENACQQLSVQNQELVKQRNQLVNALNQANLGNLYKKLDYLFKVIEDNKDCIYLSEEFKINCGKEIETLMAAPEDSQETPTEETHKEE